MTDEPPLIPVDLTSVHLNDGRATAPFADWDLDRDPVVGDRVLASDGGPSLPATITEVREDGSIVIQVDADHVRTPLTPDVTSVRVVHDHVLELTFADGLTGTIDLGPHVWGPAFQPLRDDYTLFCTVTTDPDAGTIVWLDGELDVAPETLYLAASKNPVTDPPE